jgi:hypothetical protein
MKRNGANGRARYWRVAWAAIVLVLIFSHSFPTSTPADSRGPVADLHSIRLGRLVSGAWGAAPGGGPSLESANVEPLDCLRASLDLQPAPLRLRARLVRGGFVLVMSPSRTP